MRLILAASTLLVLMVALWAAGLLPRSGGPSSPAPQADRVEIARLRQEVRAMQAESTQLRRLMGQVKTPAGGDVGREGAPIPETPREEESAEQSFENDWLALDHHFASEAIDETWTAREELARKLPEVLPRTSHVRSLECRSTMCRLETSHADEQSYREFMGRFTLQVDRPPIWTGPAVFRIPETSRREGDELVATALLARESFPPSGSGMDNGTRSTKETGE
jgi:hypothetical protein